MAVVWGERKHTEIFVNQNAMVTILQQDSDGSPPDAVVFSPQDIPLLIKELEKCKEEAESLAASDDGE